MNRLLFLFMFLPMYCVFSQAPGGVTTDLTHWFKADIGTGALVNGDNVVTWEDQSTSDGSDDATKTGVNAVTYQENIHNYNPSILFINGDNGHLNVANDWDQLAGTNYTIFAIVKRNTNSNFSVGNNDNYFMGIETNTDNEGFRMGYNSNTVAHSHHDGSGNNTANTNVTGFVDTDTEKTVMFKLIHEEGVARTLHYLSENESSLLSNTSTNTNNLNASTADGVIGRWRVNRGFEGYISEIIVYTNDLSAAEQVKVETYLALKYGLVLDTTAGGEAGDFVDSNDNTIWDVTANTEYNNNVGGIINDVSGGIHQKIANPVESDLIISTDNNFTSSNTDASRTDVVNNTYLLFGDNAASIGFKESSVTDKVVLNKKWLFKESSTETNNIFIAVSEDLFPSGETVEIIVSGDDVFDDSDTTYALTNSGGLYHTTAAIDIDNNDRVSFLVSDDKVAGISLGKISLYIKADENSLDGSMLTLEDQSKSLANAVQNLTDNTPVTSDLMNFNPTLTFDGTDDYLYFENKHYNSGDEIPNLHTFAVFSTDYNDGGARTNNSFLDFDRVGAFASYIRGDGRLVFRFRSGGVNFTETGVNILNDGRPHIAECIFDNDIVGDDTFVKYDGIIEDSDEKLAGNIVLDKTRYGFIGDDSVADEENGTRREVYYNGQISEIILSDTEVFTTNETIQIESYLALKYGITLDSGLANYLNSGGSVLWGSDDLTNYGAATETTYWNGIAGIVKDDVNSNLDQKITQSTSAKDIVLTTLNISAPATPNFIDSNLDADRTSLNEGSYLLFGNNGEIEGGVEENVALSKSVTNRHWLFKEGGTNLDDNVNVAIPKSFFPDGSTGVVAYISSDDIFDIGDTMVALSDDPSGDYYYFSRDMDDGDFLAFAITTPVGIGPGNVSSGLTMWIKSDKDVTSSGGIVTSIMDSSFNGNNLSRLDNTNNGERPTINISETNYNPTMSFDEQYLAIENLNYNGVGVLEKIYAWVVYKTDFFDENTNVGSVDIKNNSFLDFDGTEYFNMDVRGDGKLAMSYRNSSNGSNLIGVTVTNTGTTQLGGFIFDNTIDKETILRLNGAIDIEDDLTNNLIGRDSGGAEVTRFGYVGTGSDASTFDGGNSNRDYEGSISEIIYYEGETLNADKIQRIESYLAVKYGVTLESNYIDSNLPTANIIWDRATNVGYNNDITIIGRDDDSDLNQKQSKSENLGGVLTISIDNAIATSNAGNSGSFDDNLDFLAWGNDSSEEIFIVDCTAPLMKVNKNWRVQNTGNVGAVTMQFDMSNISDPSSYELILDTDGDFTTTGDQTIELFDDLTGTDLTFETVILNDGMYFSLFKSSASDIVYDGAWSGGSGSGGVPNNTDLGKRVIIENSVTLTESFNCNCLTVDASQAITVPTGMYINANEIKLDGDIYLEGTAELIQTDDSTSNSGNGQLYKIIGEATDSPYRYNFYSSPVNTSGAFVLANNLSFNNGLSTLATNTSPTFIDNVDGSGTSISRHWLHKLNNDIAFDRILESTTLNPGVGFTMKGTGTTDDYNFIGSPNNGEINIAVDQDKFLLTGNPYPSTINIDAFNVNMLDGNITDGTVYLWDQPIGDAHADNLTDNIGGYATRINGVGTIAVTEDNDAITGVTEPSAFIKPGQGFIVSGTEDDSSVQFNNALRSGIDYLTEASPAHFFKKANNKTVDLRAVIHLGFEYDKSNGNVFHRQIATVLENESTMNREIGKDAYMFDYFDNDAYWVLPDELGRFVITSVPTLLDGEDVELPIGVVLDEDREVTFKLDKIGNVNSNIYLFDNETNSITNIINDEYSVLVSSGENNDRFSLVFKGDGSDSILNSKETPEIKSVIYADKTNINVILEKGIVKNVEVYDFTGKQLISYDNHLRTSNASVNILGLSSKMVIVKVITDFEVLTKKISLE